MESAKRQKQKSLANTIQLPHPNQLGTKRQRERSFASAVRHPHHNLMIRAFLTVLRRQRLKNQLPQKSPQQMCLKRIKNQRVSQLFKNCFQFFNL